MIPRDKYILLKFHIDFMNVTFWYVFAKKTKLIGSKVWIKIKLLVISFIRSNENVLFIDESFVSTICSNAHSNDICTWSINIIQLLMI